MADTTGGAAAEPFPQPSMITGDQQCCRRSDRCLLALGITGRRQGFASTYVVKVTPAVKGKNGVSLPCSVKRFHIFPIIPVFRCAPIGVSVCAPNVFPTCLHCSPPAEYDPLVPSHPVGVTSDSHTTTRMNIPQLPVSFSSKARKK